MTTPDEKIVSIENLLGEFVERYDDGSYDVGAYFLDFEFFPRLFQILDS